MVLIHSNLNYWQTQAHEYGHFLCLGHSREGTEYGDMTGHMSSTSNHEEAGCQCFNAIHSSFFGHKLKTVKSLLFDSGSWVHIIFAKLLTQPCIIHGNKGSYGADMVRKWCCCYTTHPLATFKEEIRLRSVSSRDKLLPLWVGRWEILKI